jgi:hypothetical protein
MNSGSCHQSLSKPNQEDIRNLSCTSHTSNIVVFDSGTCRYELDIVAVVIYNPVSKVGQKGGSFGTITSRGMGMTWHLNTGRVLCIPVDQPCVCLPTLLYYTLPQ